MRTNSPAPIKLTKMYEEISILIVQVNYSTLIHILILIQAFTFIFNKLVLSKITLLSYSMHCYNINSLNLISKLRTRRKALTWKPVKPVCPSSALPTLTSNHQCTAVHRNVSMLNTCNNHLPLHSSPTSPKELPSACTTVRTLFLILTISNHLLKPYTNLFPILNNINNLYAKYFVFKNITFLITLKCPNCRIQWRTSTTNTPEPSCSLHPPLIFLLPQVAKINSHRCLCLISQPSPYIRYPAYLLQQHSPLYTTSSPPYNPSCTTSPYMSIQLHNKSHNLCTLVLFYTNAVPIYVHNQLHNRHSIRLFFRHRMANSSKATILQEYLQELEDRFAEIQQFNIPPTPTFLHFHRTLIQLVNQVRKEMLHLLEMLTLMAEPSIPIQDKLNSMYRVMAKLIEVTTRSAYLNYLTKHITICSTLNHLLISLTLTTTLPPNHLYLPSKQNFKNLKTNYINCLRKWTLKPKSRTDPTRFLSWMTPFPSPTLPRPPLNPFTLPKFLARLPYVLAYLQSKIFITFYTTFSKIYPLQFISEIYLPWLK